MAGVSIARRSREIDTAVLHAARLAVNAVVLDLVSRLVAEASFHRS